MTPQRKSNSAYGSSAAAMPTLVPIEAAYFYPGMYIDFNVYLLDASGLKLLFRDTYLDDALVNQLDNIEAAGNSIGVLKQSYKTIILNAAASAAAKGTNIDWDFIRQKADNPPSFDQSAINKIQKYFRENVPAARPEIILEKQNDFTYSDNNTYGSSGFMPSDNGIIDDDDFMALSSELSEIDDTLLTDFDFTQPDSSEVYMDSASFGNQTSGNIMSENILSESALYGNINSPNESGRKNKAREEKSEKAVLSKVNAVNTLNDYVENWGNYLPNEKVLEIRKTVNKVREYFDITVNVQNIIQSSSKNYSVSLNNINATADKIVNLVRQSAPEVVMQSIVSLTEQVEYMPAHTQNVAAMNTLIGSWLELPMLDMKALAITGLMHDLGKLLISDKIMNKPTKLSAEEFNAIKKHPVHSYNIAVSSGITDEKILLGIRHHHEKINGTGYPDGLKSGKISQFACITAISDIYDAMISKRSHKSSFSPFEVMQEFAELRFTDLNIKIVNVVLDKMADLLKNKQVILSDGSIGEIININPSDYANPIITINGKYIKTSNRLRIKAVSSFIPVSQL